MLQYFNILLSSLVDLLTLSRVMNCCIVTIILSFYVRLDVALKLGRSNAYFCNFRPPPFWYTLNKSHIAHSRNSYSREKLWLFHNVDIEKKNLPIENWIVPLFIYKILSPLNHTRMFGTNMDWNWLSCYGEKDIQVFSLYVCYFIIIFSSKRTFSFIWTKTWISFTQWCFVLSLIEMGMV